jgi:hypothetical protein
MTTDQALTLEQLELADLITDDGKARCVLNLFPVTVDGERECRLYLVAVPGEEDEGSLAVVWYRNVKGGPQQVEPIQRVLDRSNGAFTTQDGIVHSYVRTKGCGCGNRLKNWSPFDGYVRVVHVARQFAAAQI